MGVERPAVIPFNGLGKLLILFGTICIVIGAAIVLFDKVSWLGRLPGDIYVERRSLHLLLSHHHVDPRQCNPLAGAVHCLSTLDTLLTDGEVNNHRRPLHIPT